MRYDQLMAMEWDGQYHALQWMFLFFSYSILGWCWEPFYQSVLERKLVNRGFLYGPCIPLYGAGATLCLMATMPFKSRWWMVMLIGMVVATVLEEVTGRVMESLFDVRYWSYENYPGNIDNFICIPATLLWGGFALLAMYVLNVPFERLLYHLPVSYVGAFVAVVSLLFVIDITVSVRDALDFKEILFRMANTKKRLGYMRKRLDVMIAFYDRDHKYMAKIRMGITSPIITLKDALRSVKERLEVLNEIRLEKQERQEMLEEPLKELDDLKQAYMEEEVTVKHYSDRIKRYLNRLLHSHPRAYVKKVGGYVKEKAVSFKQYISGREKE